jgi:hypothetical protein
VSTLAGLYKRLGKSAPPALVDWDSRVDVWCSEYAAQFGDANLSEINLDFAVFLFDHTAERVTLAYAVSVAQLHPRDVGRMRAFPDVNVGITKLFGTAALAADRGHFLGHASGGTLDINLFPQDRKLNRGWSNEGKRFRAMEREVARHPGTFFYHRPMYDDRTWIPWRLEYAILRPDGSWWKEVFTNRPARTAS